MAEIIEFLSPEAIKQIDGYIKSLTEINDKYSQLAKTYDTISDKTRQQIKDEQELEKLYQQKLKTDRESIKNEQLLAKETERKTKAIHEANSEWGKLNKNYKEALRNAQEMGAKFGTQSKQFKEANKEATKYRKEIEGINKPMGKFQSYVGNYFGALMKFAGGLGLITGGVELFKKGIDIAKQSIQSIQTTADKFDIVVGGLKEGWNSFLRGMATGGLTLENVIQNFKDAVSAGREYVALLDDLGDKQKALRVAEANAKDELLQLEKTYKNSTLSNTERIAAIDKYIAKEQELADKRAKVTKQAFTAEMVIAAERSDLNQNEIMDYITNYEAFTEYESKKNEEYQANQEKLRKIEVQYGNQSQQYMDEVMRQNLEMIAKPATEQELKYREIIENMAQLDDKIRDRIVSAYEGMKTAEQSALENTMKAQTKRATLIDENLKKEAESDKENIEKITNKRYEEEQALTQFIKDQLKERLGDQKELSYELTDELVKRNNEEMRLLNEKKAAEKAAADEAIRLEEQKQSAIHDLVRQTSDFIFSIQEMRLQQEMASLDSYYQARINAASNLGQNTEKLEREYARKKAEIQVKEFKLNQQKALADIAIATAVNSVETPALTGFYIAMGAIQAALVLAQQPPEIPAYSKGTKDAAHTFIAGEAGAELMRLQNGTYELADSPKLYSGKKYQHAEIFPHAETQRILAENQIKGSSMAGVEKKLDKLIAKDNKPTINIINKYNQRFEKRFEKYSR